MLRVCRCVSVAHSSKGFDESTPSLVAGELSMDHLNGSVTSAPGKDVEFSAEKGFPEQTPVQVSDLPYDPIHSPSQDDLRPRRIDSIPEDSTLDLGGVAPATESTEDIADGGYVDMDINDVTVEGGVTPARDVMNMLEAEATNSLPTYVEATHEQVLVGDNGDVTRAHDASATEHEQSRELQEQADVVEAETIQVPVQKMFVESNVASERCNAFETVTSQSPPAAVVTSEEEKPSHTDLANSEVNSPVTSSRLRVVAAIFIALFVFVVVAAIFVFETDLDLPLMSDLRTWPHVASFRRSTYLPFKTSIARLFRFN